MFPKKVIHHFHKVDPKLLEQVNIRSRITFRPKKNYFMDLCQFIVCQQLSDKAASSIWKKFLQIIGERNITPKYIAQYEELRLREIGISWSKVKYVKNVATAFRDNLITIRKFPFMTNEEIITQLVTIKGVGRWTAEMFLMFSLGREDVFSIADLGLRKGIQKLMNMKKLPGIQTMNRVSKKWSPYRTYAALLLWKSLE